MADTDRSLGGAPMDWLARRICTANVLLHIHHGDLEAARSVITSGAAGYVGGGDSYHVHGGQVTYRFGDLSGQIRVSRLVAHAASRHDPAVGDLLAAAYRRYVYAATTARRGPDWSAATAELHSCEQQWWRPRAGQQLDLFTTAEPPN